MSQATLGFLPGGRPVAGVAPDRTASAIGRRSAVAIDRAEGTMLRRSSSRGFTMIEVLVTIAILMIGLLGLAALQTNATVAELEAYQRSQALVLVQDMADRISANKANADSYKQIDIGLTVVNYGFPIVQLASLSDAYVPVIPIGSR